MSDIDIDCPGDFISYNCSIQSNSEYLHLTWRVTVPGFVPINITYDEFSDVYEEENLNGFISTTLLEYMSDEYVESSLLLSIDDNFTTDAINFITVECFIEDLGSDADIVTFNISGTHLADEAETATTTTKILETEAEDSARHLPS